MKDEIGQRIAGALERIAVVVERAGQRDEARQDTLDAILAPLEALAPRMVDEMMVQLDRAALFRMQAASEAHADMTAELVTAPAPGE